MMNILFFVLLLSFTFIVDASLTDDFAEQSKEEIITKNVVTPNKSLNKRNGKENQDVIKTNQPDGMENQNSNNTVGQGARMQYHGLNENQVDQVQLLKIALKEILEDPGFLTSSTFGQQEQPNAENQHDPISLQSAILRTYDRISSDWYKHA